MTAMPGSWTQVWNLLHWSIALKTGMVTAVLAVLLSLTPLAKLYRQRVSNAVTIGCLTAIGDTYSHLSQQPEVGVLALHWGEVAATGAISAALALAGSYVFEDRARRLRALWARVGG